MKHLNGDQALAVVLAANDLLQAHRVCSAIPVTERTAFEDDIANMGRNRLMRLASREPNAALKGDE